MENCGRALVLYLIYFILGVGCVQVDLQTGTNYTFHSNVKEKIDSVEWRYKNLLVCESDYPDQDPVWYRYDDRAWIDKNTGQLTLQVMKKDSGEFLGKFQVGPRLHIAEYTVNVFVDPPVQADFSWIGPNGFSELGESINITMTGTENLVYYCTVSNQVSKSATEFNLADCN